MDKARVISFLGVRTDRQTRFFGILVWQHVGTQKISTQSSKLGVSCRSLYASPEDGGCINMSAPGNAAKLGTAQEHPDNTKLSVPGLPTYNVLVGILLPSQRISPPCQHVT